ncbi:ABC transporter ATP-binding protein [Bauldia sp.]|uniref:ABC transporter ATP-binding protein n=1 Tax=Bauldia sp. TaxID=2575872 RepID=UPI003BABE2EF
MLEVSGLSVSYGAIRAVRNVGFALPPGEILALVGPNGAGKSSTLMALVGLAAGSGDVRLDGDEISTLSTEAIVRRGLTLCPEGRRIFTSLTVGENLRMGAAAAKAGTNRAAETEARLLELFPILEERRGQLAGTLSGGEQQMLAIARALMSRPKVLLLDEPSLGLAPRVTDIIFDTITSLRDKGQSIVLVEQNVERALDIADRACVMTQGEIVKTGYANRIRDDDGVRAAYFGVA